MLLTVLSLASFAMADDPWNYNNQGKDWDFANCNVKTGVQSPITINHNGPDWYKEPA